MFGKTCISVGALLALASAQTAPGFPVTASQQLTVTYGNNTVRPAGELIPRPELAQPPTISTPVWTSGESGPQNGVLLMVDSDVPRNGTRIQLLHWLATNVTLTSSNSSGAGPLLVPTGEAPYRQPNPPVGDSPHAYTFVLFAQPPSFTIPEQYAGILETRIGFDTAAFVRDAGLGQTLAANYLRVQNLTGTPTTSFPPPRPTGGAANSSTPAPFPGAAQPAAVGGITFWAAVSTALLAGVAAIAL